MVCAVLCCQDEWSHTGADWMAGTGPHTLTSPPRESQQCQRSRCVRACHPDEGAMPTSAASAQAGTDLGDSQVTQEWAGVSMSQRGLLQV